MKLFAKGKGSTDAGRTAPVFQPIDRGGLLGLLDQIVNGGQSGTLELHERGGTWTYAFQAGALTHASGGRVRAARQAFDLLWEFGTGEFQFTPGAGTTLAGNLYIDKNRLQDLVRRSQAVLQGPGSPYIAPDQQRPIQPVQRPYSPPAPGQIQTWQPAQPGQAQPGQAQPMQQQQQPAWQPQGQPGVPQQQAWQPQGQPGQPQQQTWQPQGQPGQPPQPAWQPQGQPGQPQGQPGQPGQPAWGNGGYPPPPPGYQQPYPQAPYGQGPQAYPQPYPAAPQPPVFPGPYQQPQQMIPPPPAPAPAAPALAPAPAPSRPVTPPSFSVPPMAIPKRKEPTPVYQPPVAPASAIPPVPEVMKPAAPSAPKDDLQSLRASLIADSPATPPAPSAPAWGVRSAEGAVAPAPAQGKGKAKTKGKGNVNSQKAAVPGQKKAKSKFRVAMDVRLIKFLLWACERKYSADDHWTLQDAFEVSTMELRDQFIGAFSESFKAGPKKTINDDDVDQMAAGRMRGRAKKR